VTSFVLINQSSQDGAQLAHIAAAVELQLNCDFAPYWGGSYKVRVGAATDVAAVGDVAVLLLDALPDAPDAAGYHDTLPNGAPIIRIVFDASVSVTISHECLETAADPGANRWAWGTDGSEYALEVCDPVEAFSYDIDGVSVSAFVLPDYFDPGSTGPFAFPASAPMPLSPLTVAVSGGQNYQIVATIGGNEKQVTARGCVSKPEKRGHPSSRTYKRGVRLA
jgi:hypothetical protein